MPRPETSKTSRDGKPAFDAQPFAALALFGWIVPALLWMAFGLFAFFLINGWSREYNRKIALIEQGRVPAETLTVARASKDDGGNWGVVLAKDGKDVEWRSTGDMAGLKVGDQVPAYRFDDGYLIPRLDRGNFWFKWVMLGIALLPLAIGGGVLLFMRKSAAGNSAGNE